MTIIAVTGKRGSGKDTFADFLRDNFGFEKLDFSTHTIIPILEERKLEHTRNNLINIAMELRSEHGNGYFAELLCKKIDKKKDYCISGMRFPEELDTFRNRFKEEFILVSVMCDSKIRFERVIERGDKGERNLNFEDFMKVEKRVTEKAIDEVIIHANFFIDNNGNIESFEKNIRAFEREMGK